jgi:hypothetical protein
MHLLTVLSSLIIEDTVNKHDHAVASTYPSTCSNIIYSFYSAPYSDQPQI